MMRVTNQRKQSSFFFLWIALPIERFLVGAQRCLRTLSSVPKSCFPKIFQRIMRVLACRLVTKGNAFGAWQNPDVKWPKEKGAV